MAKTLLLKMSYDPSKDLPRHSSHRLPDLMVDSIDLHGCMISTDASPATMQQERLNLVEAVRTFNGDLILVSNETNMGITPLGELTRRFCDEAGLLHQALAEICDNVTMVIAGLPQQLK